MKKKKRLNNRGFMLVETLIVSVFIMAIFSLLYTNIFPLVGEYDRIKNYDTIQATYVAHWARKIALKGLPTNVYTTAKNTGYVDITNCSLYTQSNAGSWCQNFKTANSISRIYLTSYNTTKLKTFVKDNSAFSRDFREYIAYLPAYSKNTSKTPTTGYYRVIVEYDTDHSKEYGTMEVKK